MFVYKFIPVFMNYTISNLLQQEYHMFNIEIIINCPDATIPGYYKRKAANGAIILFNLK